MPVHDWTRIYAGAFHDFHHEWLSTVKWALANGLLPSDYYAMVDQIAGGLDPDVLALHRPSELFPPVVPLTNGSQRDRDVRPGRGVSIAERRPRARFHVTNEPKWYANKRKVVSIRHVSSHEVVAVVEIVSPGNKNSRYGIPAFTRKAEEVLAAGVHLTVIDVFPPGPRDPRGIHPLIWGDETASAFEFDAMKPLTCAAYVGGPGTEAFVETFAVGDPIPDIPLFLTPDLFVEIPLNQTYEAAYERVSSSVREVLEAPPAG